MITDKVIQAIEKSLDTKFDANIVPEREAYPTSGYKFIRVTGNNTIIAMREASMLFTVNFMVQCSIRTRDFLTQNKSIPYAELLDLQEQCFLHLITDQDIYADLYAIAENISITNRMRSSNLNTMVQNVGPGFYGSSDRPHVDTSTDREAGYLLTQYYTSPEIIVPLECLELPSPLNGT